MLEVAQITRPHGVHGAVKVNCGDEQFLMLKSVFEDGSDIEIRSRTNKITTTIEAVMGTPDKPIVRFHKINSRNDSEKLRGAKIFVSESILPTLEEDEFMLSDLKGLTAIDRTSKKQVGEVVSADKYPANDVLTISGGLLSENILCPFTNDAVGEVSIKDGTIEIDFAFLGIEV